MHPELLSGSASVESRGTHVGERRRDAVVGVFEHNRVFTRTMGPCEAQRKFAGLAFGVNEVADGEFRWELREEALRVPGLEVDAKVRRGHLSSDGLSHTRVSMSDQSVADACVEKRLTAIVNQV